MSVKKLPLTFWEEHSPEGVLFGLVSEMKHPIDMVKVYSKLLLSADVPEGNCFEMLNIISRNAEFLESISEATEEYTSKLRK